ANIREVDAIAHVLRCFADHDVVHVDGAVDPARDREVVETELMLKDLEALEKKRERRAKDAKAPGNAGEEANTDLELSDQPQGAPPAGAGNAAQRVELRIGSDGELRKAGDGRARLVGEDLGERGLRAGAGLDRLEGDLERHGKELVAALDVRARFALHLASAAGARERLEQE